MSNHQQNLSLPPHKSHRNINRLFQTIDHTYSTSSHKIKKNPQLLNMQNLKSKNLDLRSNNHKRNLFYSLDDVSNRSLDQSKIIRIKTHNYLKLPPIKSKPHLHQTTSPYQKLNPRHAYHSPTANSILKAKEAKDNISESKRICSVNCLKKHERRRKKKAIKDETHTIRKYLADEAEANYPETQLNRYLSRMKTQEDQKHSLVYQTYFGIQPQFYRLETQYARQISQIDMQPIIEDKSRTELPTIPSQEMLAEFIQEYQPYNKEIDLERLLKSSRFIVEYSRNQLFFGEMVGNSKEGVGISIENNKIYEGIFKNNYKVRGVEVNASGIYKGQFFNEKRSGDGEFEWLNGQYYIGEWKDGNRHGTGVWTNKYGDSYNGEWKMGKGQGWGIYIVGGQEYKGHFVDFKKEGWGKEAFINGDSYEGEFRQGLPEGRGRYTWHNGTKYEGQFITGLRNGKGSLKTPDGFHYKGEFLDERPQGLCQIFMPNGDTYHGYLKDGRKNGRGTLFLRDSHKTLDGFWQNDNFISGQT